MSESKIEWTDVTWNPTTGCTKRSDGCRYCYAETMARRLKAMGVKKYKNGFKLTLHQEVLKEPYKWHKPRNVFVNSMSDLFHADIPDQYRDEVFEVIRKTPIHNYQVLTKRSSKLKEYFSTRSVPANVWLGVTVEDASRKYRIDNLREINAKIRFLSLEPLLGNLGELDLSNIHWAIVGGESGVQARPMKEEWVEEIKQNCNRQGTVFFFKQWGTWGADGVKRNKKLNGNLLKGVQYEDFPL